MALGNITRPPYKLVWDLSRVPNQLGADMGLSASVRFQDGTTQEIQLRGVFLAHHPVPSPVQRIPYSPARNCTGPGLSSRIKLSAPSTSYATATACITWREQELFFRVTVSNSAFYTSLPAEKIARVAVEVLLDPHNTRTPHPNEKILAYVIPVSGATCFQVLYKPMANPDGSFEIRDQRVACSFYSKVAPEDFKGYVVEFAVPNYAFGASLPGSLGCCVTATVLDDYSHIHKLTWPEKTHAAAAHAPVTWARLRLTRKPLLANPAVAWLLCFGIGFCITILIILLAKPLSKRSTLTRFELSEEEKMVFERVSKLVDDGIGRSDLSLEALASKLSITPRKIDAIFKRHTHARFRSYLARSRVEIVKERLRSSNSSETAIAESCGFLSVDEMEKQFKKITGKTPYRFRDEYRVT